MADSLLGGILGEEDEKTEVEAPNWKQLKEAREGAAKQKS